MKLYVVKKGYKTGIFTTWDECKKQVEGYKGAIYKSFTNKQDALDYLNDKQSHKINDNDYLFYVDGSYNKKLNISGYGIVIVCNNKIINKINGVCKWDKTGNNIVGEVFAVLESLKFVIKNKLSKIYIFHDYIGLSSWINDGWKVNTPIAKFYVDEYNKLLKKTKCEIIFIKVKSHSNDKYNDLADNEAKLGAKID